MLQSAHFESTTTLRDGGIQFDYCITGAERALFTSASSKWGNDKRETRVVINPISPSLDELRSLMLQAGLRSAGEAYETKWAYDGKAVREGQRLIAVAFDGDTPVGYASFRIQVGHTPGNRTIGYIAKLNFLYVDPRRRGRGFGIDLSCAMGLVCAEVVHALFKAAPQDSEICLMMTADLFFPGSEAIARSVRDAIEFAREMADNPRCQDEIIFQAGV
jgi:GNAT superfamily N-acetyltransferase